MENKEPTEVTLSEEIKADNEQIALMAKPSIEKISKLKTKLNDIVEKHKDVKFIDLKDKEGIKAVGIAYTESRQARLDVVKIGKQVTGNLKEVIKMVETEIGQSLEIISPAEKRFKSDKDKIDELKEEAAQEIIRQAEEKKQARIAQLYANGMTFNGSYYELGDKTITPTAVTQYSEEQFAGFIAQVKVEFEAIELKKAEEEAERKRVADELQKQQEELQKENETNQKKLDAANKEREEMLYERAESRVATLRSKNIIGSLEMGMSFGSIQVAPKFIINATKAEWDDRLTVIDGQLAELNKPKEEPSITVEPGLIETSTGFAQKLTVTGRKELTNDAYGDLVHGTSPLEPAEGYISAPAVFKQQHAELWFNEDAPFIDTKLGKMTLRIYVEAFVEEASAGVDRGKVKKTGAFGDSDLLYILMGE